MKIYSVTNSVADSVHAKVYQNSGQIESANKRKIKKGIEELILNPDLGKQLTGSLRGLRSLRIGDYRVIYKKELETLVILVVAIGHRKEIY